MANVSLITLKLYECYFPFVKVFADVHQDKNNQQYYRAYFQDSKLNKVGFIVRNDFFKDWDNFNVAEINLEINEKGASMIGYVTFELLKRIEGIKFIEVFGIYLKGEFIIINPQTKLEEKISFVPSLPNRYSIDPMYDRGLFDCKLTLRRFRKHEFNYEYDPIEFRDAVRTFFRISKIDLLSTLNDAWMDPFELEEDIQRNMVFESFEKFITSLNRYNNTELTNDNPLFEFIKVELMKVREKIKYLNEIKKIAQSQLGNNIKLELESRLVTICDTDFKILISNLNGYELNRRYLNLGTESQVLIEDFGILLDKKNEKISDIEFSFILQI